MGSTGRCAGSSRPPTYEQAKAVLKRVRSELGLMNQSAAKSLDEWLDETLTLHRLGPGGGTAAVVLNHERDRVDPGARRAAHGSRGSLPDKRAEAALGRDGAAGDRTSVATGARDQALARPAPRCEARWES
jgi:hypothetical protein